MAEMGYEDQLLDAADGGAAVAVGWSSIGDHGEESQAWGLVWGPAPAWRGQRARWVRTLLAPVLRGSLVLDEVHEGLFGETVLVVRATRRQACGIAGRGGRRRGRWIEVGETWNDWAMRDWAQRERRRPVPTAISAIGTVEDQVAVETWFRTVEALVHS